MLSWLVKRWVLTVSMEMQVTETLGGEKEMYERTRRKGVRVCMM